MAHCTACQGASGTATRNSPLNSTVSGLSSSTDARISPTATTSPTRAIASRVSWLMPLTATSSSTKGTARSR